ncbi:uncharacterized protein LOC143446604 isoform X2 [Clavelina lepadiformis]|uniref:uncharacterized protein LOC143446604 isoform X2 n=1 Tax=Clavelina lepadiformis TaxID=159417 RepID=UPI00404139ED
MRYNIFRIHLKTAVMKAGTEKLQKVLCCLLVLICFVNGISATTSISTDPPNNPLATGFNNLIVTAQFSAPTLNTDTCSWFYEGELDSGSGALFYNAVFGGCDPPSPGTYDSITCTEQTIDGTNHIITTLTITQPLVAGDMKIEVRCATATNATATKTPGPISITVQNCPSSLSYDVVITSSSQTYQASGMFSCPTGDLFYSNGTALPSSDTTCLANAEWSGQDNLQCWMAPSVTLVSSSIDGNKLTVIEGNDLTLTCNYDDVIPAGDTSRFYIGGNRNTMNQAEPFILSPIQRSDNNKIVLCQAVTNYTDLYPASGRSSNYTLNVLYISESIANKIETSQFVIKASESNYLLRSDQQLTMNCTPSDANPPATCSWQLCSDSRCQTLTSDGGCLITVNLNASSTVTCTAGNRAGNISSAEQTVDVVPVERQVLFNVSGNNVANDGSINSTTYLGESIMMYCSVPYENELSITYSLKLPNNSAVAQSSIQFLSVSRFDTGSYECHTNDQFGNFSAAIYLNVIYAATQDEIPTCNWNLNETGICSVVFFSNPNSQFVSLSKGEQTVASDGSMTITPTGDQGQQTFTFNRTNVENSDVGRYNLTVKSSSSSLFPNSVLYFNIVIEGNGGPPGTSGLSTGAIAGIIAGVVMVILCAAGYGVYRWRRGSQKKNGSPSNEPYPNGSDNHAEGGGTTHSNPAFNGDPEKELKINPIYASGGPTYAQVDKKNKSKNASGDNFSGNGASTSRDQPGAAYAQVDVKKKKKKKGSSEKEEKINPIYEAGDQPAPIEEAYAEVDKKKSKKGSDEKEERINPLYGSSESPDQVEAAYAEVDKKKKKKNKKGSSEKEEKVNPLYVSSDQPEPTEAAYAEVDKNKKKKQSAKEERINPLYEASSSQDQVEAAYAEVDKSKKKQKTPARDTTQVEEASNATYADVNKPKKKKKPPPPSRQTTDATQVEESSNATYAEVNKPKKKQKPPSRANNAGGDGSYDDVDLHGSSSTKIDPQKLMQGISQRRQQWSQN